MNIIATSSAGLVVAEQDGRSYDYFSVPPKIQNLAKTICNKGGNCWQLLAPYSDSEIPHMIELKQKRGDTA